MSERFTPIRTGNTALDRIQDEIARPLNDLLGKGLSGARVMIVTLASGVNVIEHALGRVPTGFLAMAHTRGATGDIADDRATNAHTDRVLYVHTSTATAATLVVF